MLDTDRSVSDGRPIGQSRTKTDDRVRATGSDRILDAAATLFAERGFGGTGMAEVAERAGVGKASVFHHFDSKSRLYCAVMARVLGRLDDALTSTLAEGGTPSERLRRWIACVLDELADRPDDAHLLVRVLVDDGELASGDPAGAAAEQSVDHLGRLLLGLLREGMAAGEFRRTDPAVLMQSLIGALVHPLATGRFGRRLVGGDLFAPDRIERRKDVVIDLYLTALTPEKEHTP